MEEMRLRKENRSRLVGKIRDTIPKLEKDLLRNPTFRIVTDRRKTDWDIVFVITNEDRDTQHPA